MIRLRDSSIVLANDVFFGLFGIKKDNGPAWSLRDTDFGRYLASTSGILSRMDREPAASGQLMIYPKPDGLVMHLVSSWEMIMQDSEAYAVISILDVTEKMENQTRYVRTNEELMASNEELDAALEELITSQEELNANYDKLRESEENYRGLVENMYDIVFAINTQGTVTYISPNIDKITGYAIDDVIGKNFIEFVYPDDVEMLIKDFAESIAGNPQPLEYRMRTKDGRLMWVHSHIQVICKDGEITALKGIMNNITEQKLAEEALYAEKEQLSITLCSIGDGVITTDIEGNVLIMNEAAERITGKEQGLSIGTYLTEVLNVVSDVAGKALMPEFFDSVIDTRNSISGQMIMRLTDRASRTIYLNISPIIDHRNEPTGAVIVFRDITQQLIQEKDLQKQQKIESQGVLAGGIAHDFNNILTVILGNLSLLKMQNGEHSNPMLNDAERAILNAKHLTQQLLTFAKGGMPVKEAALIPEIIYDSALFVLSGSKVKCRFLIDENLRHAEIDVGQISQVIQNIVINAVQVMPSGGVVEIRADNYDCGIDGVHYNLKSGEYVKISITDQGIGIKPDIINRIFDPFFTTKEGGSGLGLAVAHSIVLKHSGILEAASLPEGGAVFSIYLPASDKPVMDRNVACPITGRGAGHILLMDDEDMITNVMGRLLERSGYRVITAMDGNGAINLYEKAHINAEPIDVLVLDMTVPGKMGGLECLNILKDNYPFIKAIVSSGYSNDPVMANYKDYGFAGAIVKPNSIEELRVCIASVIKLHSG